MKVGPSLESNARDPHHLPAYERQRVSQFLVDLFLAMHTQPWRVLIMDKPAGDDAYAEVRVNAGYLTVELYLSKDWVTLEEADKLRVLLHEGMHVMHAGVDAVMDMVKHSDAVSPDMAQLVDRAYRHASETMCDHLANLLRTTHGMERAWATITEMYPAPPAKGHRKKRKKDKASA